MRAPMRTGLGGLLLTLLFLAAIYPPLLGFFAHVDQRVSQTEKRELAPFPGLPDSLESFRAFPKAFDRYFQDRFGLRQPMITLHNWINVAFFAPDSSSRVVKGADDWYYLRRSIQYCETRRPLDRVRLERWAAALAARRDLLARRGAAYLFVIAPAKPGIYPEHLPEGVRLADENALDQLSAFMAQRPDIPFLDLRPALRAAAREARVYETTDTHWNDRGALAAALRVVRDLRGQGVDLPPDFAFTERETRRNGGDLAQMLGLQYVLRVTVPVITPEPPAARKRLAPDYLGRDWKHYPALVWDTPGLPEEFEDSRLVMFGDSFTMSTDFSAFLAQFFGRSVAVHRDLLPPDAAGLAAMIQAEHPTVVVEELVERDLTGPVPATDGLLGGR